LNAVLSPRWAATFDPGRGIELEKFDHFSTDLRRWLSLIVSKPTSEIVAQGAMAAT
jgi:hypothetical protein